MAFRSLGATTRCRTALAKVNVPGLHLQTRTGVSSNPFGENLRSSVRPCGADPGRIYSVHPLSEPTARRSEAGFTSPHSPSGVQALQIIMGSASSQGSLPLRSVRFPFAPQQQRVIFVKTAVGSSFQVRFRPPGLLFPQPLGTNLRMPYFNFVSKRKMHVPWDFPQVFCLFVSTAYDGFSVKNVWIKHH